MDDQIVLVDDKGVVIGSAPKLASHHADTPLHLGFSCYVFDNQGRFLLTQRAHTKKVWPDVWTNSFCGHPAPRESYEAAILRRLKYELGIDELHDLQLVDDTYRYKTVPYNGIIENEICPIYIARVEQEPQPNPTEIEAYLWQSWDTTIEQLTDPDANFSYWLREQVLIVQNSPLFAKYSGNEA